MFMLLCLAQLSNLAFGSVLFAGLLWTLARTCRRMVALPLGFALYLVGSLPAGGLPDAFEPFPYFFPNFHIYQMSFGEVAQGLDGSVLFVNFLYGAVWMAYLTFCNWLCTSERSEHEGVLRSLL